MDLSGKVAVVTGSGQGLGLAYASALAASGASVIINDVSDDKVAAAVNQIEAAGGKATGRSYLFAIGSTTKPLSWIQ